ncbi:hydantoinase/oxoprolinase family protein, partial [Rhizobiaceae sp. 2RAB30]
MLEVKERLGAGGGVLIPLDEESVRSVGRELQEMAIEAVAVCLLHAFANPDHERRVASILSEMLPGIAVSASTDVLPVVREFERSLTAVLNATVMPGVTTYVSRLEERLNASGVSAPLLLMQSNGGIAGTPTIRKAPALTGLSGPAAGIVGAKAIAERCGIRDLITVDIGGTSADICLIKDGRVDLTSHGRIGNWPLSLPMVDMVTIGAGGGSIARVEDGTLTVGPQSAGASPGPASYGRGGTEATVTDAHVVLGHMPARLLGGAMKLDLDAARQAVRRSVADELDLDVDVAARGILA